MTADDGGAGGPAVHRRVCFLLHIRPEKAADYLRDHENVWPDMLHALRLAGWRNYTLFHRASDGLVVGYFETEDLRAALKAMEATEINRLWQDRMTAYFQPAHVVPGDGRLEELTEYFHLD